MPCELQPVSPSSAAPSLMDDLFLNLPSVMFPTSAPCEKCPTDKLVGSPGPADEELGLLMELINEEDGVPSMMMMSSSSSSSSSSTPAHMNAGAVAEEWLYVDCAVPAQLNGVSCPMSPPISDRMSPERFGAPLSPSELSGDFPSSHSQTTNRSSLLPLESVLSISGVSESCGHPQIWGDAISANVSRQHGGGIFSTASLIGTISHAHDVTAPSRFTEQPHMSPQFLTPDPHSPSFFPFTPPESIPSPNYSASPKSQLETTPLHLVPSGSAAVSLASECPSQAPSHGTTSNDCFYNTEVLPEEQWPCTSATSRLASLFSESLKDEKTRREANSSIAIEHPTIWSLLNAPPRPCCPLLRPEPDSPSSQHPTILSALRKPPDNYRPLFCTPFTYFDCRQRSLDRSEWDSARQAEDETIRNDNTSQAASIGQMQVKQEVVDPTEGSCERKSTNSFSTYAGHARIKTEHSTMVAGKKRSLESPSMLLMQNINAIIQKEAAKARQDELLESAEKRQKMSTLDGEFKTLASSLTKSKLMTPVGMHTSGARGMFAFMQLNGSNVLPRQKEGVAAEKHGFIKMIGESGGLLNVNLITSQLCREKHREAMSSRLLLKSGVTASQ